MSGCVGRGDPCLNLQKSRNVKALSLLLCKYLKNLVAGERALGLVKLFLLLLAPALLLPNALSLGAQSCV